MRVAQGHIVTREEVEVDTVHNYVVVHNPPIGDFKSVILFHDYNLVRSVSKKKNSYALGTLQEHQKILSNVTISNVSDIKRQC